MNRSGMKNKIHPFLAHLSRRLTGELIVYPCSGVRPSVVRPSVVHHVQRSSSLKPLGQILYEASTVETELNFTPLCTSCAHDVHDKRAISELRCATQVQNEVHLKFCSQSFIEVHFLHDCVKIYMYVLL